MDSKALIEKINKIQWEEQMNVWMSEKYPEAIEDNLQDHQRVEDMLIELGNQLSPEVLDKMEQEGEIEWALRLSFYVSQDDSLSRGKRYINDPRYIVNIWAKLLTGHES